MKELVGNTDALRAINTDALRAINIYRSRNSKEVNWILDYRPREQ